MLIRIKDLSQGIHRQSLQEPASSLGFEEEKFQFLEPITAHFILQKLGDQIICRALVSTLMQAECSRCLEPVEVGISEEMTMLLTFSGMPAPGAADQEIKVISSGAKEVDVSEEIRQTILLAIPGKPLCKTDCRGLCPHCGTNLNLSACHCQARVEDPRLSGLVRLLSNKSKGDKSGRS